MLRKITLKAAPFSWTGFYLGAEAGGAWGRSRLTQGTGATDWYDLHGGFLGGTAGFNLQFANVVVGAEGDMAWAEIATGPGRSSATFGCGSGPCETDVRSFGTARGRLGLTWNRLLFYGTGGAAFGFVHSRIDNAAPFFDNGGKDCTGWTAGGGAEWAFADNVSAKLEYLHVDFGTYNIGTSTPTPQAQTHFDLVRLGVNVKLWSPK